MKLLKNFSAVSITFLFVLCFSQTTVLAQDKWLNVQSKNFRMIGNASEKDIRRVGTKLEQFREAFRQIFPRIKFNSAIPTNVVVFKSEKSFRAFKPVDESGKRSDWVAGYFQAGEDVNYIVLPIEGEKENTYQTIFHEYVHFLINNDMGRSVPPWFNEGLAEYYDKFLIENDQKVTLGGLDNNHLLLLRNSKLIPFDTFFNIDHYALHRQERGGVGLYYAQAWALMHYLMQGNNGARNPQLSKFVSLVMSGKKPEAAFGEAFETDYATMERELKKYIEQRSFRIQIATFKEKLTFDSDMKTTPFSDADAKAILGDLHYRSNRLADSEALLKESLKLDPNSIQGNMSYGLLKARQRNFPEARKALEKAVSLDDTNYNVHYQYAYALSREGMDENNFVREYNAELAEKMRLSLRKSIALNPNFAKSFELYAFVAVVQNEGTDEAINYLRRGLALAPGNQWFQLRLAELYRQKEDS